MGEELGLALAGSVKPSPRFGGLASQPFVFLHGPSDDVFVDAFCDGMQPGAVEGSVVVDPASDLGVDPLGESGQVRSAATVEVPVPDLLADRFVRLGAHGWCEAHEEPVPATDQATPEGVAEKAEAGVRRVASAIRVFAVHDLRLVGVQLKANRPEPLNEIGPKISGLFLGVTVDDHIIRVALKGTAGVFPVHPTVEHVVHEEVRQQRRDRRTLRGSPTLVAPRCRLASPSWL
ncbi:MAG: hypothetical protein ACI8Y4_003484 [Candidatus Poriferisodalaceae bacterium]